MTRDPCRVVFDCVIFAQGLINPQGPAGGCLKAAECGDCLLHVSEFVFQEIRELPSKLNLRHSVRSEQVETLIQQLREYAVVVADTPELFQHPSDPKDAAYVNLALATNSELVVSRDRHLLTLMDRSIPEGRSFVERFPHLRIVKPVEFLRELDARKHPKPTPDRKPPEI